MPSHWERTVEGHWMIEAANADKTKKRTPGRCKHCNKVLSPGDICYSAKLYENGRWFSHYYCGECHRYAASEVNLRCSAETDLIHHYGEHPVD